MEKILQYLGGGQIYNYTKSAVHLNIVDFSLITNKIIPLFKEYPLVGVKSQDYLDWCKIHKLMLDHSHLTVEGLNLIRGIKLGMNRGRNSEELIHLSLLQRRERWINILRRRMPILKK